MKKRYLFLDILKAIAVGEMIHGHSLDALLDISLRSSFFFINWSYFRGFTAPIFLFSAGFAFAISTIPRKNEYSQISGVFLRRIRRILFIVILGYLMHLPYFSLRKTILSIGSPEWQNFLKIDILQCIGVSAIFLQFFFLLNVQPIVRMVFLSGLSILFPLFTPYLLKSSFILNLPDFLKYYFISSRFPIFPFASYLFEGCIIGEIFLINKEKWFKIGIFIVISSLISGYILKTFSVLYFGQEFLIKSGFIVLLTILLNKGENLWKKLPAPLLYLGQESLLVYVVHLAIVYGSPLNKGLRFYIGPSLSYAQVYMEILWLFSSMMVLSFIWNRLKKHNPVISNSIKYSLYTFFIISFILRPF